MHILHFTAISFVVAAFLQIAIEQTAPMIPVGSNSLQIASGLPCNVTLRVLDALEGQRNLKIPKEVVLTPGSLVNMGIFPSNETFNIHMSSCVSREPITATIHPDQYVISPLTESLVALNITLTRTDEAVLVMENFDQLNPVHEDWLKEANTTHQILHLREGRYEWKAGFFNLQRGGVYLMIAWEDNGKASI